MGNTRIKSIEQMYNEFLLRIGLSELSENTIQYKEMRKAFIIGASVMFKEITVKVAEMPEQIACNYLDKIHDEILTLVKDL